MNRLFLPMSFASFSLALLFTACSQPAGQQGGSEYKLITVEKTDQTLTSSYTAVINGRQSVEIRPQVSGTITDICVNEGAKVTKGQEAAVATSRLTAESKEELFREHVVSDFDRQTAQNSLLEAEATLAQAKAEEINARNNLSYTVIKSPVDGVASMSSYRVGALVNSSITTPLLTVSDDEEIDVYFSMTEQQILSLARQYGTMDKALEEMPEVELRLSDGGMYAHKGKIDAISGTTDTETGAITLRAVFPNPERMLRNGSTATIIFPYVKKNVFVIPQEATFEIQDRVYVYKVNSEGKAESAQVTVFPLNNGKEYIVEDGLQQGETIVAEGAGLIQENTQVATSPVGRQ